MITQAFSLMGAKRRQWIKRTCKHSMKMKLQLHFYTVLTSAFSQLIKALMSIKNLVYRVSYLLNVSTIFLESSSLIISKSQHYFNSYFWYFLVEVFGEFCELKNMLIFCPPRSCTIIYYIVTFTSLWSADTRQLVHAYWSSKEKITSTGTAKHWQWRKWHQKFLLKLK